MSVYDNEELLDNQVMAIQGCIPRAVIWRGTTTDLDRREQLAAGRAVWFIVKKGYGLSTAVARASRSPKISSLKIERATRAAFPSGYFTSLEKSKNKTMYNKLAYI